MMYLISSYRKNYTDRHKGAAKRKKGNIGYLSHRIIDSFSQIKIKNLRLKPVFKPLRAKGPR